MTRRLLLFEDERWRDLRPLTDTLPVPALAFGGSTLENRWSRRLSARRIAIEARQGAMRMWDPAAPGVTDGELPSTSRRRRHPHDADQAIAINAASLPGGWIDEVLEEGPPALFKSDGRIAAARLRYDQLGRGLVSPERIAEFLGGLEHPTRVVEARFLTWPWQIVEWNPDAILEDLADLKGGSQGIVDRLASIQAPKRVLIEADARVEAYAVLDAREGPIRIGRRALVASHTVVTGPCVIGDDTQLLGGFVGNSTIGPNCRIAGEVDSCVWQGWANKRHHGFVGHSVIGEWVNLGALTTTSDLKNNYGSVRVWVDGREIDSGASKVGSFIGAHAKTGIGTLLPTGASVGVGANLFGGGRFAPKQVPSFGWWDGERMVEHRLDEFLETARIAMSRRGRSLDPAAEQALRALFEATAPERRNRAGVRA